MEDSTSNQVKPTPLLDYLNLLARRTVGDDEPYHIDLALGIVQTQYQTWNIVIPDELLGRIGLEEG